jgi:hypothetical protein
MANERPFSYCIAHISPSLFRPVLTSRYSFVNGFSFLTVGLPSNTFKASPYHSQSVTPNCPCFAPTLLTLTSPTHSHRSSLVPQTSHSAPIHTLRASPQTPPVPPSPGHGRSHPGTRAAWAPHTGWSCGGSPTTQPGCPDQSSVTGPL